ncbi:uncharacterized protein B0T23DRAFT_377215 [Neurospora hispaniola]|uniref:Uncharacterized protein n=1 Tax=Neurospora hispaniola TaxID=588809 RepID=A0AAJ0MSF9_9PEZI|nr:hypothetical protein B0T23DRAFT_377215 [Neurospora hispaniola]
MLRTVEVVVLAVLSRMGSLHDVQYSASELGIISAPVSRPALRSPPKPPRMLKLGVKKHRDRQLGSSTGQP